MQTDFIQKVFRFNVGLALIGGLFVFWQYVQIRSEPGAAVFLGFSPLRLVILLGVLLILGGLGYFFLSSWRPTWWNTALGNFIVQMQVRGNIFWFLLIILGGLYIFLFSSEHTLGRLAVYRVSLDPILLWFSLVGFAALVSFLVLRAYEFPLFQTYRDVLLPSSILLLVLGGIIVFIVLTRIGLQPDAVYWQDAGTPILLPQVWAAWFIGLLLFYLLGRFKVFSLKKADLLICFGLWVAASLLWLNQPLTPAYNALEPKAPNFQIYPFGDALLYDVVAHGFLIGQPIQSDFWIKPLYSLLLSILHLFSKENFGLLVSLQVIVLASIPVFVYLLTSELSNRPAGLVAAVLVMIRERNGIALSNVIEVSHVKLLMSDVFTMGLMCLMLWLIIRYIKRPEVYKPLPFIIGGMVAMLTLTRGHPILLLPIVACILLFLVPRSPLRWRSLALLVIGFALPLIPWFWRNYETLGKFAFQNPISVYSAQVARLYSMTPGLVATPEIFGEIDSAYYERLQKDVVQFVIQHPGELIKFVSAHYAHNAVFSYIYLPHSFALDSLRTYVKTEPFWRTWTGSLSNQGWVLLFINILVLSLGLGRTWRDAKWHAFVPLLMGVGYNLSVAVGRLSGWRFILPADWITLVYYSIGLMQIAYIINYLLSGRSEPEKTSEQRATGVRSTGYSASILGFGTLFLSISLLLTYGQRLFAERDTSPTQDQLVQIFQTNSDLTPSALSDVELAKFLPQENAVLLSGRALYPGYFKAQSGALNYYWLSYSVRPYDRIVFHLMRQKSAGVVLPTTSRPTTFPDGADVIVLGCRNEAGDIDALSVVITSTDPIIVYNREPMSPLTCPLAEPE